MTPKDSSRRDLIRLAAFGAASTVALSTTEALAFQGNMERALAALHAALESLRHSTPNKGGHRERAMELVQKAILQTQASIRFANHHSGGVA